MQEVTYKTNLTNVDWKEMKTTLQDDVWTLSAYRRQGIARQMMDNSIKQFKRTTRIFNHG